MKGGYSLLYQLGSQVIQKVCATQSQYFNLSMFNLLDRTLSMEKANGPHRDTKILERDPGYAKYGPLGVCINIQEKYSDLVTINNWPAISAVIPESNLGAVGLQMPPDRSDENGREDLNGYLCYECNSKYHLRNNCPVKKKKLAEREMGGDGVASGDGGPKIVEQSNSDWKFIAPADDNVTVTVNILEHFYCKHYVFKNTNRRSFFNRTHTLTATTTTSVHSFSRADDDTASTSTETTSLSSSGASAIYSLISTASPASNLGDVTLRETKTSLNSVNEDHVDKDPDGLEFVGAYFHGLQHCSLVNGCTRP